MEQGEASQVRNIEIYKDPNHAHNFESGKFLRIPLDEEATKLLVENLRPKNHRAVYVILTFDGRPDPNMPLESQWERVKRRAVEEEIVVYNSSRRHGSRVVWAVPPSLRTNSNCFWEKVKLYPSKSTLEDLGVNPQRVIVRNREGD